MGKFSHADALTVMWTRCKLGSLLMHQYYTIALLFLHGWMLHARVNTLNTQHINNLTNMCCWTQNSKLWKRRYDVIFFRIDCVNCLLSANYCILLFFFFKFTFYFFHCQKRYYFSTIMSHYFLLKLYNHWSRTAEVAASVFICRFHHRL